MNACTDLSAMVVEGIGLYVEDILVSFFISIIISWTFRKTNTAMFTKY